MQGVSSETLSAFKFPVNREKYREYRHFSAYFCVNVPIRLAIIYSIQESWRDCIIDAMNEQGMLYCGTGNSKCNRSREQGKIAGVPARLCT